MAAASSTLPNPSTPPNYLDGLNAPPQVDLSSDGDLLILRGALKMPNGEIRDICITVAKENQPLRLAPVDREIARGIQQTVNALFRAIHSPKIQEPALGTLVYDSNDNSCFFIRDPQDNFATPSGDFTYRNGDSSPDVSQQRLNREPTVSDGASWILKNLKIEPSLPQPLSSETGPLVNQNGSAAPLSPSPVPQPPAPQQPSVPNAANTPPNSSGGSSNGVMHSIRQGTSRVWNQFKSSLSSLNPFSSKSSTNSANLPSSSSPSTVPAPLPNANPNVNSSSLPSSSSLFTVPAPVLSQNGNGNASPPSLPASSNSSNAPAPLPNANPNVNSSSLPSSSSPSTVPAPVLPQNANGNASPSSLPASSNSSSASAPLPVPSPNANGDMSSASASSINQPDLLTSPSGNLSSPISSSIRPRPFHPAKRGDFFNESMGNPSSIQSPGVLNSLSTGQPQPTVVPASIWNRIANVPNLKLTIWTVPSQGQPLQPQQQKIDTIGKRTLVRQASFSSVVQGLMQGKQGTFLQNSNVTSQIQNAFDALLQDFENPMSEDAQEMKQWLIDLHKQIKEKYGQGKWAMALIDSLLCARKSELKEYQQRKIEQGNDPRNRLIAALQSN